ncbi:hypothetical protein Fcan01_24279 [Folsomia candida]|uniref:Uncharacterized protein n=1 Tax=Folsomia candida TaxID=158441 RepID=A0A226D5Y0_FOLCA|nr:hypothetical protein Fcan01_24279 [Folsomia candida]
MKSEDTFPRDCEDGMEFEFCIIPDVPPTGGTDRPPTPSTNTIPARAKRKRGQDSPPLKKRKEKNRAKNPLSDQEEGRKKVTSPPPNEIKILKVSLERIDHPISTPL